MATPKGSVGLVVPMGFAVAAPKLVALLVAPKGSMGPAVPMDSGVVVPIGSAVAAPKLVAVLVAPMGSEIVVVSLLAVPKGSPAEVFLLVAPKDFPEVSLLAAPKDFPAEVVFYHQI